MQRFGAWYDLVLRKTAEISKGRQMVPPEDVAMWQKDLFTFVSSKPELLEALQDPDRIANNDETAVEVGL